MRTPKISRSLKNFINVYNPPQALVLTKGFWGKARSKTTKDLRMNSKGINDGKMSLRDKQSRKLPCYLYIKGEGRRYTYGA